MATLFYLAILMERTRNPPFYNKSIFNFSLVCDTLLFWVSFCVSIHAFLDFGDDIDDVGIIYTFIGGILISILSILLVNRR